jgi:hypothetical protein
MNPDQLDLFEWAESRQSAVVLDWHGPFAARVLARIHEYDDRWPKPANVDTVVRLRTGSSELKRRKHRQ